MSKLHFTNPQVRGVKEREHEAYIAYDEWSNDADDNVIEDFGM